MPSIASRTPASNYDWDGRKPKARSSGTHSVENLYRAYELTRNSAFKSFGDIWQYPSFWNKLADIPPQPPPTPFTPTAT